MPSRSAPRPGISRFAGRLTVRLLRTATGTVNTSLRRRWGATLARSFGLSAGVADFTERALTDALHRAGEHFDAPARWLAGEAWIEDAVDGAQREGLRQVVTLYPPVGPWADRVEGLERRLAELGITLARCRRTWDDVLWPLASRGFFTFRKAASRHLGQLVGGLTNIG